MGGCAVDAAPDRRMLFFFMGVAQVSHLEVVKVGLDDR